jgi:vacuolar-type H+-ATPase subunit H
VEEKTTTDLQFHQQTVANDDHSPLHLIREKEMEISGRVLAAKRKADEIVAEARRDAAALVGKAQEEAGAESASRESVVKAELEQESAKVRAQAQEDAQALEQAIGSRLPAAVTYVIDSVISV